MRKSRYEAPPNRPLYPHYSVLHSFGAASDFFGGRKYVKKVSPFLVDFWSGNGVGGGTHQKGNKEKPIFGPGTGWGGGTPKWLSPGTD